MSENTVSTGETSGRRAGGRGKPRRELLTGAAAAALGVVAAEALGTAPAQATQGQAVILGTDNTGATAGTTLATTTGESAVLADPGTGRGVIGFGSSSGAGVTGLGGPSNGIGVVGVGSGNSNGVTGSAGPTGNGVVGAAGGAGDGVQGSAPTGNGVHGIATAAAGVGVLAENTAGGTALKATGRAVFSRSGILTVAAGKSSGTVTGVALTRASLALATLQQNLSGVYVRAAVPNVAAGSFTVYLSKAPSASAKVAWFVVN